MDSSPKRSLVSSTAKQGSVEAARALFDGSMSFELEVENTRKARIITQCLERSVSILKRDRKSKSNGGYVPNINVVLQDLEERQRKSNFCKFIARGSRLFYGLICTIPASPLRKFKNLRDLGGHILCLQRKKRKSNMEAKTLIFSVIFTVLSLRFLIGRIRRKPNLPPSPAWALPVIGHLRLLKPPIYRTFLSISQSLGDAPIFSLRLGNRLVFVNSSHSIAEECFTKNDVVLANRPNFILAKHVAYDYTTVIAASYGDHWRNLRRICSIEIFSNHRLNSFLSIRQDEIRRLILRLSRNFSQEFAKVEMKSMLSDLTFNNIIRMVAGKRYYGDGAEDDPEAKRVRQLIADVVACAGAGNAVDYLPVLRWVSDYETRVKKLAGRLDEFLQGLVDEKRGAKERGNTMVDHLLSLQESQPDYFTDRIIKGNMVALILAGTDTSAVTLEWALSNLLNHPEVLKKAREEIDGKIGLDRLVEESDISNLPYLQNIVSETLRLYPAAPTLLPHVASEDCKVGGFDMPRGTILLTNAWAIHRDPKLWDDPTSFKPERFEKEGEAQKLMAFGLGRRACPGSGLAHRLINLTLGSLIQCLDWERIGEEEVDMTEGKGVTMPKAKPLEAMCRARASVDHLINQYKKNDQVRKHHQQKEKMEFTQILLLSFLLIFITIRFLFKRSSRKLNLPPSPAFSLPVIGHLHLLKPPIHRRFLSLSQSLGNAPIFHLRLGYRHVYVVTSHAVAEECFTKNDIVLADRPDLIMGKHVGYDSTNMLSASYGDHWRNLRRIAAVEIFSTQRLNSFLYIRKDEIRRLISRLSRDSLHGFAEVEMKSLFTDLASNNIIRMVAGKRYYGVDNENNEKAKLVKQLILEVMLNSGAGNPADYLSIVRWGTNYEKQIKNLGIRFDAFLQELIDEKRDEKGQTMVHRLLSLQETHPAYYTDELIKGIILVLIAAGTNTTSITLEWAMSNLLNHPEILKKARTEIDEIIGSDRLLDEPDVVNLPYLQNIVSETFRMYPALPVLVAHMSSNDCKVGGYDMPRGTMLLTNVWAMHRDPKLWEEPERFKPERFEKEGEDQKLMPFGMGRRACPGAGLAQRLVCFALGSLVQCFEWERVDGKFVDMTEGKGASMPKATPLRAMCKARTLVGKVI
ncbi:unnamed protein product [Thlaspi arvense]|uniref:Cytochrome P450 n=1 Tax=Thlaspi arvense TaxID=13288 RepID=A0AAU9T2K0_THLAR|nr:unnamed protein product [Thlaspi arvense]